jgi:4-hydroxy-tetrahydrodipicolinate reductase
MIKIILHGAMGRMGRAVIRISETMPEYSIVAGIDTQEQYTVTFPIYSSVFECDIPAHVVINFSTALAVPDLVSFALSKKLPVVICTTGLSAECVSAIKEAGKEIPVFQSANMSLGINILAKVVKQVSAVLAESGFDIEILEKHHNKKQDAPSGTALLLADAINADNQFTYIYDRTSQKQPRQKHELGISSIRGGTIVGEHSVFFAGQDEVIEFSHSAFSRDVFAIGSLKAAGFIVKQPPGLYSMADMLNDV